MAEKNYNEELCEQVRQGKLAIHNTDIDGITELVRYIFPGKFAPTGKHSYYWAKESGEDWLCGYPVNTMPSRPVSDFLIPTPPDKVEGGKEGVEEEAKSLVEKFMDIEDRTGTFIMSTFSAKQCALIHCQLMIDAFKRHDPNYHTMSYWHPIDHYENLKAAINKL